MYFSSFWFAKHLIKISPQQRFTEGSLQTTVAAEKTAENNVVAFRRYSFIFNAVPLNLLLRFKVKYKKDLYSRLQIVYFFPL